ncbi:MAG: ferrous iron transport protein A [Erysipelotrichaceae bacterium]|nr:ferrous iron transport protein A [Erysipelotrichaceae bacterium]MBQ4343174.1 hypothetical protein [Erysipelotrichaceae bacterium]
MRLSQVRKKGNYEIAQILPSVFTHRLLSFGFTKGNKVAFTGMIVHDYHYVVLEDKLLAVPNAWCTKVVV